MTKQEHKRFSNLGIRHLDWMALIWDADLPSNAKLIAAYLNGFMNSQRDIAWPSLSRIKAETNLGHGTVLKYLEILENEGWISRERGNSTRTTSYIVRYPEAIEEAINNANIPTLGRSRADLGGVESRPRVGREPTTNSQDNKQDNSYMRNEAFTNFWEAYPKKKSKGVAEKTWKKIDPSTYGEIMAGLSKAVTSEDWVKDDGKYIPYPSTWLNAKGWEDEDIKDSPAKPWHESRAGIIAKGKEHALTEDGFSDFQAFRKEVYRVEGVQV